MKNILVPTDFSKNASDAAYYAAALANITGARLLLFHAYHVSVALADAAEESIDLDLENFENLNQTHIDKLAYDLHQKFKISVTRIMRPGFAADEIPAIAKRLNADLVVMGMRGKGQPSGSSIGKITEAILQECKVPVLCIPAGLVYEPFSHINFTYKSASENKRPALTVIELLENLFGTPVVAAPDPVSKQTTHLVQPSIITHSIPSPPDFADYMFNADGILTGEISFDGAAEPEQLIIIRSDKNTLKNIAAHAHLADDSARLLPLPVLALPDGGYNGTYY
jgi:nucleotide-binding universal stress UspA family protein